MPEASGKVSGLRTRFAPKSRVGQGLISLSPWLDFVMLLLLFVLVEGKYVLTPGLVVNLPEAPVSGGLHNGISVVVLSVESAKAGKREEVVFMDDEPFHVNSDDDMKRLTSLLARHGKSTEDASLLLFADERISHGTISRLCDIARERGIFRVNVATRSPEQRGAGW